MSENKVTIIEGYLPAESVNRIKRFVADEFKKHSKKGERRKRRQ